MANRRPKSVTAAATGLTGLVVGALVIYLIRNWDQALYLKTLAVIAGSAGAMIAVDFFWFAPGRAAAAGLAGAPVNPFQLDRFIRKLIGFWLSFGALAAAYWLFPEYAGSFYQPFYDAVRFCLPILIVGAPLYIFYVDRRQVEPEDGYAQLGALVSGHPPADWTRLGQHARAWIIKGFFLPLMFVYLSNYLEGMWSSPSLLGLNNFHDIYDRVFNLFFLVDVLFSTVGYIFTLRLLDTHVRSAEPSMVGWLICLVCYAPFFQTISPSYTNYDDGFYWGDLFQGSHSGYVIWGSAILALLLVYCWATMSFGLRFSNLTNRGIITNGPYALVKHPAYLTKNISWWLISVPFISQAGWVDALHHSLLLGVINLIYIGRAITEERHLSKNPDYRAYQAYIREYGLFARIVRLVKDRRFLAGSVNPGPAE